jgi:serine/threonine-protein kinase
LLTPDGEAKVTDFGIARSLDVEHGLTQTGTVLGTSNYLSPEQASGHATTPATDVYSLGVVLYELLTGEVPFPGENFVAVAMKHINDLPPDVLERRPDVPIRLAAAVDRAMAKDPAERFPTMDQFAWELRQCLAELDTPPDAERTIIAPSPVLRESRPHRARAARSRAPVYAIIALLAIAAIVAGILGLGGSKGKPPAPSGATGASITLSGVTGYDPQGTGGEHNGDAAKATDGDPSSYWQTEHYASPQFGGLKDGVGLVLDAGRTVALKSITVTTDTPGYTAEIQAGSSPTGSFAPDSSSQQVGASTTFTLNGKSARYFVVWITNLGTNNSVHVNEVKARS